MDLYARNWYNLIEGVARQYKYFDQPMDEAINYLIEKFKLDPESAKKIVQKTWATYDGHFNAR